jgi:predicted lipase
VPRYQSVDIFEATWAEELPAQPTIDVMTAIQIGQLQNVTYDTAPSDLTNKAGQALSAGGTNYTVVTTIYANDLATDMNPSRGDDEVSIGLICQAAKTGDVVITIRGTEGTQEWIQDAEFLHVPCPFLAGAGHTEDGFTAMYESLRTGVASNSPTVVNALAKLSFPQPASSLTICGHSLGGALATLLALDVAANTAFSSPAVYTFGSPRTGDSLFASTYDQVVKNSYRIANRLDIVPTLPPPVDYDHVLNPCELNPIRFSPLPPKILVKFNPECEHSLQTYLYLLSLQSGGPVFPLESTCQP